MVHWIISPDHKFPTPLNVDATEYSVSEYNYTTLNNSYLILVKLYYENCQYKRLCSTNEILPICMTLI